MKLNLDDEQKKLFKRTAALAKSYKASRPEIDMTFQVESGGGIVEDWSGSECIVQTNSGPKDINYEPFYNFIMEFIDDNRDTFLQPFDDQSDNSWGEILCEFNFETKTLSFTHNVSYYESSYSEEDGQAKPETARKLIEQKNASEDCQGEVVHMRFDGGGDSGYIESEAENELGDVVSPTGLMEDFGYEVLERHFGGWENNEGGSGTIILNFSVQNRVGYTIEMNMNGEEQYSDNYDFEIKLDY